MKKVTIQGSLISHERYLQIAALDMLNSQALMRCLLWDPKEPSATRPLALLQDRKLYSYGHDFLKNITELFDERSQITTTYDYSPYGAVTASRTTNNITQPYQWSSEITDPELALSYYNYRHYNPRDGRWINRDLIAEQGGWNLYGFVSNSSSLRIESLGLTWDNVADSVLNGIFYAVEVSVNQAGDILASALGYGSQAEIINQLDQPVGNSETHRGDWIDAIQDAGDWLKGETPANTDYGVNSDTSYAIKNATQGKELIMQFLKNNKNAKKCLEWQK